MKTLEQDGQEVVQRHQEGVGPLAGEVRREGGVLLGGGDKWQDEPIPPLGLTLQLQGLLLEKLLSPLQVSFLEGREDRGMFSPLFCFTKNRSAVFRPETDVFLFLTCS